MVFYKRKLKPELAAGPFCSSAGRMGRLPCFVVGTESRGAGHGKLWKSGPALAAVLNKCYLDLMLVLTQEELKKIRGQP